MKLFLISTAMLFCVACTTKQGKNAFAAIGDYYGAKVSHGTGFSAAVGKKTEKFINLYLHGGPYIGTVKSDQLAVYAAVLLYANLNDKETGNYTHFKINLFDSASRKEAIYKRTYDVTTIKSIAAQSASFQQAGQLLLNGSLNEMYNLIIEKHRSAQQVEGFAAVIDKLKADRSGVKGVKLLGVESLIDNKTKDRYLGFNGQVEWGNKTTTSITVRTFEDTATKGIIHLNIQ